MLAYCNERAKRKRLGRSGTFMAQWFRRWTLERATRGSIPTRSVTLVAAVTRIRLSGSFLPWLKVAQARGLGFQKGGSNVTIEPSVRDWVVQVPLWPSGLSIGLWNERPRVWSPHGSLQYLRVCEKSINERRGQFSGARSLSTSL